MTTTQQGRLVSDDSRPNLVWKSTNVGFEVSRGTRWEVSSHATIVFTQKRWNDDDYDMKQHVSDQPAVAVVRCVCDAPV
jgi:hypothetical protein